MSETQMATMTRLTDTHESDGVTLGPIILTTLVAALGGFLFGYDTAVIAGAIGFLRTHFALDDWQAGWATSCVLVGCIPGAMFAGFAADRFGRKRVLLVCAALFAISGVASAVPKTFSMFIVARFVGGLAIGASSMICPLYIAEIAPEKYRGRLGALFQLGVVVGILLVFFVNLVIQRLGDAAWNVEQGWRWMLGSETAPAVLFLALLATVAESPRWLAVHGRLAEAKTILIRFVGERAAERELAAISGVAADEEEKLSELFSPRFRRPLGIGVGLAILCQLSGINAVMYYAPEIFKAAGWTTDAAFASTVWVGVILVAFTVVAMFFVDRAGRRPLLLIGTAIQAAALFAIGALFRSGHRGSGVLVFILLFVAAFAMSMGPISWIIISEIFPSRIRGRAVAMGVVVMWSADYAVSQTFLPMTSRFGDANTFFIYASCAIAGFMFTLLFIPETKGRSLEQIEASWLA